MHMHTFKGRFLKINPKLKICPQEVYMYFKRNKIWKEDEKVEKREREMLMLIFYYNILPMLV